MKEETEDGIAEQIMWLRRMDWKSKHRWQARQVSQTGHPLTRAQAYANGRAQRERVDAPSLD